MFNLRIPFDHLLWLWLKAGLGGQRRETKSSDEYPKGNSEAYLEA